MSDATYYTIGMVEESTYGTTPASALQLVNVTEFPLARTRSTERPNVLTGSRRRYPTSVLQEDGGLTVPCPIQYGNMLMMREGLLANDIAAAAATITATDISTVGATGVITSAAGDTSDFEVGDWVYISGSSVAGNNGWKGPLTAAGASSITVPAAQVEDEAATASITISTTRHTDGSTQKSYSAEWRDTLLTNKFRSGTGFVVSQGVYTWTQGQFTTESYTLMGKAPVKGSATIGTGAATAAPTSGFINAVQDFGTIYIGSAATSYIISSLTLTVTNVQNAVRGLGSLGPSNIVIGPLGIELRATLLYDNNSDTVLGNIEDHDTIDVAWDIVDPQGNRELFYLPALKCDGGEGPAPGQAGNLVDFELMATGHDPAKDADSPYVSTGFGYQMANFKVPAP